MMLDLTAVPLAFLAGVFGVLSPCVWPLVPVVTSSAAAGGRSGPVYLAAGLGLSFAVAGTVVTWFLTSMGLDPELFRYLAAGMLVVLAAVFLIQALGDWFTRRLSLLTSRFRVGAAGREAVSAPAQFGVGAVLGFVWLPCVGPTLGAAIALASMGQSLPTAFMVMLAYGLGTAGVLLAAGVVSGRVLARWRPGVMAGGRMGKKVLGASLLALGLLVFTGMDRVLEALAVGMVPTWVLNL